MIHDTTNLYPHYLYSVFSTYFKLQDNLSFEANSSLPTLCSVTSGH